MAIIQGRRKQVSRISKKIAAVAGGGAKGYSHPSNNMQNSSVGRQGRGVVLPQYVSPSRLSKQGRPETSTTE
jgi:hypothetical protein